MARVLPLVVLALLAPLLVTAADDADVVVLNKENFNAFISDNKVVMVEFFAPWCGHCKSLAPEYAKAATQLKASGILLGTVDATVESELAEQYGVRGYPTIKVFSDGDPADYEGGRTAGEIVGYLKRQTGPAVSILSSVEAFKAFVPEEGEPVLVAFLEDNSKELEFFSAYAQSHRNDNLFGAVTDSALAALIGESVPSIVVFKPFDDRKSAYTGELEAEALTRFVRANMLPLFAEITPGNYRTYVGRGLPIGWLFVDPADTDGTEAAKAAVAEVSPDAKGVVSLVHLNGVQYKQMVQKMALSGNVFPCFAIESADGSHFVFPEATPITKESFQPWLAQYIAGSLRATIKSEPIPANAFDDDHVRIVVGDNFDEVVMDKSKDVLIEFYAPWCGHCKHLAPIYGALATELKDVSSLVIAKMDSTANDAPADFKVSGFPTIKFVNAHNTVTEFDGPRTRDGFLEFLKKHAVHAIPAANDEL